MILLIPSLESKAQYSQANAYKNSSLDSLATKYNQYSFDVPAILIGTGIVTYQFDKHFYGIRDNYFSNFEHSYDDYTQYLPAIAMYGMKAAGVESRSTWKEMIVADVFSILIVGATVNGLKYTIRKQRPDKSARNSYPSGHTTTAFMTATMLHKEYGHLSPLVSLGAYSCAAVTGFTRQLNNRHYMSDVIAGAGIGILSVEVGYLLSDLIFRRANETTYLTPPNTSDSKPSFIGVQMGVKGNLNDFNLSDGRELTVDYGSYVGLEGAWYFNKNWGVGGQTNISSYAYGIDNQAQTLGLGMLSAAVGAYFSQPLSSCFRIETKGLVGGSWVQEKDISEYNVSINNNLNYTLGTAFSYWSKENLSFKLFGEYKLMPNVINDKSSSELTIGLSVNYMLNN